MEMEWLAKLIVNEVLRVKFSPVWRPDPSVIAQVMGQRWSLIDKFPCKEKLVASMHLNALPRRNRFSTPHLAVFL